MLMNSHNKLVLKLFSGMNHGQELDRIACIYVHKPVTKGVDYTTFNNTAIITIQKTLSTGKQNQEMVKFIS